MAVDTSTTVTLEGGHWYALASYRSNIDSDTVILNNSGAANLLYSWTYIPSDKSIEVYPYIDDWVYMTKQNQYDVDGCVHFGGAGTSFMPFDMFRRLKEDGYINDSTPWIVKYPRLAGTTWSMTLGTSNDMVERYFSVNSIGYGVYKNNSPALVEGHLLEIYSDYFPIKHGIQMPRHYTDGSNKIVSLFLPVDAYENSSGGDNVSLIVKNGESKIVSKAISASVNDSPLSNFCVNLAELSGGSSASESKIVPSSLDNADTGETKLKPLHLSLACLSTTQATSTTSGTSKIQVVAMGNFPNTSDYIKLRDVVDIGTGKSIDWLDEITFTNATDPLSCTATFRFPYGKNLDCVGKNKYYLATIEVLPYGDYAGEVGQCYMLMGDKS